MAIQHSRFGAALLALAFSIAARADISGTQTLASSTALNLDTGTTAASGGDLLWNGTTLVPQGKARAASIGNLGAGAFEFFDKQGLSNFSILATSNPVNANLLVVGEILAVFTNGNNVAAVLVTAKSGGSITLQFNTFITVVPTGPVITAVQNNSSHIQVGLPNYGITPSSIFVIVGTGLADPLAPVLQSSASPGLQTTLSGATINVTVKGVTVHPPIYYTSATQIAAVLPAATPIGSGTITVTYKGVTSAAFVIQVVASALGINTYNFNTAVATDAVTGALLTYTNSGAPGETIVLWTTGLGADPGDSDTTYSPAPHSVNTSLQIYIGNTLATILYQGSAGYPGVNQINLVIPSTVPNGCYISIVAVAGGVLSNGATLPINKGGGACVEPESGLNGNQIPGSGTTTIKTGLVELIQTTKTDKNGVTTVASSVDAAFEKYNGIYSPANSVSPGGCIVNDLTPVPVGNISGLDAGTITFTALSANPIVLSPQPVAGAWFANLTPGAIPQSGGSFTFKGSGGKDVGSFSTTLTFTNPLLTWTNPSVAATVDRSKDLTVTWTGGNPGSYLFITGTSVAPNSTVAGGYTCQAAVDDGKFTVPSYILSGLPAGNGGTLLQNIINSTLSATGLDYTTAGGTVSTSVFSTIK
jgi:uncharacterized protein (TIGR03437 family)